MKNKKMTKIFFCMLLWLGVNQYAFSFYCNFSSSITTAIDLNDLKNIGDEITLYDFTTRTCNGDGSTIFLDALRIFSLDQHPSLKSAGIGVYFKDSGRYYDSSSVVYRCIWPWSGTYCPYQSYSGTTYPMIGAMVIRRDGSSSPNISIPANSEIATLDVQQRGRYAFGEDPSWGSNHYIIRVYSGDALTFPTCDVETQDQTVNFPVMSTSMFSGVGSQAGKQAFSVVLNCPPGITAYTTITDSNQISNASQNVSLNPGSSANGVNIQILYNSNIMQLGGLGRFKLNEVDFVESSKIIIPFSANYIQTKTKITPGSVNAQVVMSFDYM